MKRILAAVTFAGLTALGVAATVNAQSFNVFDDRTYLTFSGPVSLPGVTLPAGRYIFRVPGRYTSRSVIQVLSADQKTVYAMLDTAPAWRQVATGDPEVTFKERAADAPPAIARFFQPLEHNGYEFLYPKAPPIATVGTH